MINGSTRLYFIIGDPIAQVKSPEAFNCEFQRCNVDAVMLPLNVDAKSIDEVVLAMKQARNVDGIVLTVPHKFAGYRHSDTASEASHFLKAANVMRRSADGWHGGMVDGVGYVRALRKAGCSINGSNALVVGAGGAGSAIAHALIEAGAAELFIHDEDHQRRDRLVKLLTGRRNATVCPGTRDPTGIHIAINATPMGMRAVDPFPIAMETMASTTFVGDVITVPAVTPLLDAAQKLGCKTMTGAQMYDEVFALMFEFFGCASRPQQQLSCRVSLPE
jgi:shikimate dehydrogenase